MIPADDHAPLLLRGGRLVLAEGVVDGSLLLEGGLIREILPPDAARPGLDVFEARGLLVLPGAIDPHVHLRDPGLPEAEDMGSGTAAAVAGGVTTVLDMPNTSPPTTDLAGLRAKQARIPGRAWCDVGIHAGITSGNAAELDGLARGGIAGFKCYIGPSTGGLDFPGELGFTDALRVAARFGLRTVVHAEDEAILERATAALRLAGRADAAAWAEARPAEAEVAAVAMAVQAARVAGARLHIAHVSAAGSVPLIAAAREAGQDVTAEVTPHHWLRDLDLYARIGVAARVNPPVRTRADREALDRALRDGIIGMLASDHAPHPPAAKQGSLWDAASGLAGVQLLLVLAVDQALRGEMAWETVLRITSGAAARAWDLADRGALVPGLRADVALLDPGRPLAVSRAWWRGRAYNTAFDGERLAATPVATFLAGHLVMQEGDVVGSPRGQLVTHRGGEAKDGDLG